MIYRRGNIKQFFRGDSTLLLHLCADDTLLFQDGKLSVNWVQNAVTYSKISHFIMAPKKVCYSFNGSTSYITTSAVIPSLGNSARTILIWFRLKSNPSSSYKYFVGIGQTNSTAQDFSLSISDQGTSNYYVYLRRYFDDQRWLIAPLSSNFFLNRWRFLALVYPGTVSGDLKLYIDCVFYSRDSGFSSGAVTFNTPSNYVDLGRNRAHSYGDVEISEFALFNRALSFNEISSYYRWAIGERNKSIFIFGIPSVINTRRRLLLSTY
jgi:hypothetical protein